MGKCAKQTQFGPTSGRVAAPKRRNAPNKPNCPKRGTEAVSGQPGRRGRPIVRRRLDAPLRETKPIGLVNGHPGGRNARNKANFGWWTRRRDCLYKQTQLGLAGPGCGRQKMQNEPNSASRTDPGGRNAQNEANLARPEAGPAPHRTKCAKRTQFRLVGLRRTECAKQTQFRPGMWPRNLHHSSIPLFHHSSPIPIAPNKLNLARAKRAKQTQFGQSAKAPADEICETKPNLGRMGHLGDTVPGRGRWRQTNPIWWVKCAKRTQFPARTGGTGPPRLRTPRRRAS
jgi:hypothetical protein